MQKTKTSFRFLPAAAVLAAVCWSVSVHAAVDSPSSALNEERGGLIDYSQGLKTCTHKDFGIQFTCDPDWKVLAQEHSLLIIVSDQPAVTLTITRIETDIVFFEQLTRNLFEDMQVYAEGFRTETVEFAGHRAVKVKAFSKEETDRRLIDYYFLEGKALYGVLWSVHPKEEFKSKQFFIKDITESFRVLTETRTDVVAFRNHRSSP